MNEALIYITGAFTIITLIAMIVWGCQVTSKWIINKIKEIRYEKEVAKFEEQCFNPFVLSPETQEAISRLRRVVRSSGLSLENGKLVKRTLSFYDTVEAKEWEVEAFFNY